MNFNNKLPNKKQHNKQNIENNKILYNMILVL